MSTVVPLRSLDARAVAMSNSFSEAVLREAVEAGVLHAATVECGWYEFQGGDVKPPRAFHQWLGLRTLEFEMRALLVVASDVREGRAVSAEDLRRARMAEARLKFGRDALLRVMNDIARQAAHS